MRSYLRAGTLGQLLLAAGIAASLFLRVWGNRFGLPAYTMYHPDEHALVDRAAAILWSGDWNLHRFNYPPFYAYLQSAAFALYFLWGAAKGAWNQVLSFTFPEYYMVGRLLTGLMGTLTVIVVYAAGRKLLGKRTGLLAAALMGGCYLHIIHSHYATFDVMVGLLAVLALLFSAEITIRPAPKWYFLAGLFAGLAGATKYNGAVALVIPLAAHLLVSRAEDWAWLNRSLVALVGGFLAGFFGGNPFALRNLPDFLNGLATVLHHYGTEQPGFEGKGNWRWYIGVFLRSADSPWTIGGTAGLVGMLLKGWRKGLIVAVFPLLYYVMVSRFVVRFERNMVPVLPFLALGGGWLLDHCSSWVAERLRTKHPTVSATMVAVTGAVAMLALPLTAAVLFDASISRTDHREIAGRWVQQEIEPGTKIAVEHYSIPFDPVDFDVNDVMRISDHDMNWYRQEGYHVLIVSDGVWDLLLRDPASYPDKVGMYNELTGHSTLLAEFVAKPPRIVTAGYPTVGIYHFAPVRVYRLPD